MNFDEDKAYRAAALSVRDRLIGMYSCTVSTSQPARVLPVAT